MSTERREQALRTLEIIQRGWYLRRSARVEVGDLVAKARQDTRLIRPDDWLEIERRATLVAPRGQPRIATTSESTLETLHRLTIHQGRTNVGALNFASARNPGGGFLGGAQAQEESLARSSALYTCLLEAPGYYTANRAIRSAAYTDHAIISPEVPFFYNDEGELLDVAYTAGVVTMPAANAGAMNSDEATQEHLWKIMARRAQLVLALGAVEGWRHLVLGAWGCGVFQNDPDLVAEAFRLALEEHGSRFESIEFAMYDRSRRGACYRAFASRFGDETASGNH